MQHSHVIIDKDNHFIIDPVTRKIQPETHEKNKLVEGDHNSEKYTFEIPKSIEGHDMSQCNVVQIHYLNISSDKSKRVEDIYEVDDLGILEDKPDTLAFTWTIKETATRYSGLLSFAITFKCTTDNVVDYAWHTEIHSGITIGTGMNNAEAIVETYSDILDKWKKELFSVDGRIETAARQAITDIENAKNDSLTSIAQHGTVQVSKEEPIDPNVDLFINPDETVTFSIPEIKDETVSDEDTWSSTKINREIQAVDDKQTAANKETAKLKEDVRGVDASKISKPTQEQNGKTPRALDGEVEWVPLGLPTEEQTNTAVSDWLTKHPEATTTVQDGSITREKLADELKKIYILTFDTMPSVDVLKQLPNNIIFKTKGYYNIDDGCGGYYKKTTYWQNVYRKYTYGTNGEYVALRCCSDNQNKINLTLYGIREGEQYAVQNSDIIDSLTMTFGTSLYLPCGHFYFDRPLDLYNSQLNLIGDIATYSGDVNAVGSTYLHFNNIKDNGYAIKIATGLIRDVIIYGNKLNNDYLIDRTQTYINPDNLEQIKSVYNNFGIIGGSITKIINVQVMHFKTGIKLNTGNIYISNLYIKRCEKGISVGNDTKIIGLYGFDVGTLLEMRGSISSAVQIRADSVRHLVNLIGYTKGIYLSDLDADYCIGSIIKIGNNEKHSRIEHLTINGVHGRCCTYHSYLTLNGVRPSALNLNSDNIHTLPLISISQKTSFNNSYIHYSGDFKEINPLDASDEYRAPQNIIIAGDINSNIQNVCIRGNCEFDSRKTDIDITSMINTLSVNINSVSVKLELGLYSYLAIKTSTKPMDIYASNDLIKI